MASDPAAFDYRISTDLKLRGLASGRRKMVLTQRRRVDDDTILPTGSDDYDPKVKKGAPPKPLLEQPAVRVGLGAAFLLLFISSGFLYGLLHRDARQKLEAKRSSSGISSRQHSPPSPAAADGLGSGGGFEPSSRAIVAEEERTQGPPPRLFSLGDLAQAKAAYQADPDKNSLLLSIVGHVFDVSKGAEFYAPGNGYDFFAFRDGSRAFVTGTFTEEGLTDDVAGLSPGECQAVLRWLRFFQDKAEYPYVGRLAGGNFFEAGSGHPTLAYLAFRECAYRTVVAESDELPACSTRWAKDEGTTVWCEEEGLVPRKLVGGDGEAGAPKSKCVCVDPTEAGSHDAGRLLVYAGCDAHASKCVL